MYFRLSRKINLVLDCFASLAMTEGVVTMTEGLLERTEGALAFAFCAAAGRISPKRITLGILVALSPILR